MFTLQTNIYLILLLIPMSLSSFQLSILKDLSQTKQSNIVFSPLSIYQALSLTSNGARGTTQNQILSTLDHSDLLEANVNNYKIIENSKSCLKIANAVLSIFEPEQSFIEVSKKYKALTTKLISTQQVNQWCADNTENKITKIIDDIKGIQMIILNAVYFKSEWVHPFMKTITSIQPFKNGDGSISQVNMMKQQKYFNYFEDNNIQAIELKYIANNISAIIILPKEHINIGNYINDLNDKELNTILNSLSSEKVNLQLPKFELNFETSLVETLKQMGMVFPFDKSKADFSNISNHVSLYIDDVRHKTYLKVNEEGSEAAAVTAVTMKVTSARPNMDIPKMMVVDRPFLFMIKDWDIKDQMLFIAKIDKLIDEE